MDYNLVIQSEAIVDIQIAFEWYEAQKPGLGFELIEEIENAHTRLCKHPEHYTTIKLSFRRLKVNRFPYIIIYEIDGNNIVVNAVFHTKKYRS